MNTSRKNHQNIYNANRIYATQCTIPWTKCPYKLVRMQEVNRRSIFKANCASFTAYGIQNQDAAQIEFGHVMHEHRDCRQWQCSVLVASCGFREMGKRLWLLHSCLGWDWDVWRILWRWGEGCGWCSTLSVSWEGVGVNVEKITSFSLGNSVARVQMKRSFIKNCWKSCVKMWRLDCEEVGIPFRDFFSLHFLYCL